MSVFHAGLTALPTDMIAEVISHLECAEDLASLEQVARVFAEPSLQHGDEKLSPCQGAAKTKVIERRFGAIATSSDLWMAHLSWTRVLHILTSPSVIMAVGGYSHRRPFHHSGCLETMELWQVGCPRLTSLSMQDDMDDGSMIEDKPQPHDAAPSMPVGRADLGCASCAAIGYAVGGRNGDVDLARNDGFDLIENCWKSLADMPTARSALTAMSIEDRILAVGGWRVRDNFGSEMDVAELYNPHDNSWSTVAPMQRRRQFLTGASVGGVAYAVGGGNASTLNTVEYYDPQANSWRFTDAPMSIGRWGPAAGATPHGRLCVAGGEGPLEAGMLQILRSTELYDPRSGQWMHCADLPEKVWGASACIVPDASGGKLHVFGGTHGHERSSRDIYHYDETADQWFGADDEMNDER